VQIGLLKASLLLALASILSASAQAGWTVYDLHPPGASSSVANGVYNGVVVGGRDVSITNRIVTSGRAIVWQNGMRYDITPPDANAAYLAGTNGSLHVGQVNRPSGVVGARWLGTSPQYAAMTYAGMSYAGTRGVDSTGTRYVGFGYAGSAGHAYLWGSTKGFITQDLCPAGYNGAAANSIWSTTQVGSANAGAYVHAARWSGTSSSFVDIHPGGNDNSDARGVFGSTAVGVVWPYGQSNTGRQAFMWNLASGWGFYMHPEGYHYSTMNGAGWNAAAGMASLGYDEHAFYWDLSTWGMTDLHYWLDPGVYWQSEATSVYRNGSHVEVVGNAYLYNGTSHAMLWVYDPWS
jgi:hypothetical protein